MYLHLNRACSIIHSAYPVNNAGARSVQGGRTYILVEFFSIEEQYTEEVSVTDLGSLGLLSGPGKVAVVRSATCRGMNTNLGRTSQRYSEWPAVSCGDEPGPPQLSSNKPRPL